MFSNYLSIALNHLYRFKVYTLINISGLSLAISLCILLFLGVHNEWDRDSSHQNADKIYQVVAQKRAVLDTTSRELIREHQAIYPRWEALPNLMAELPGIERVVQTHKILRRQTLLQRDDIAANEKGLFASPEFFEMFTFPLLQGNQQKALTNPHSIVLNEEIATYYFGNDNPIGERMVLRHQGIARDVVVTGVMRKIPVDSSMDFDFVIPYPAGPRVGKTFIQTAVPIAKGVMSGFDIVHEDDVYSLHLLSLAELYDFDTDGQTGEITVFLGTIGLITLLMACVNYINLSIGLSTTRGKEVGIRKMLGATRGQLMRQFWVESILLIFAALALALAIAELAIPTFNHVFGQILGMHYALEYTWTNLFFLLSLLFFTALVAGSYPALVLSGFHPVAALKHNLTFGKSGWLGKGLIVFQFAMSTLFVLWMLCEYKWAYEAAEKDLGFAPDGIVTLKFPEVNSSESNRLMATLRSELAQHNKIINITGTTLLGLINSDKQGEVEIVPDIGSFKTNRGRVTFYKGLIDEAFITTMNIELVEGENISTKAPHNAVLINERMAQVLQVHMGWNSPLGQNLPIKDAPPIIGVVANFHYYLDQPIGPLVLSADTSRSVSNALIEIKPDDIPATLGLLRQTWHKAAPDLPFRYSFLEYLSTAGRRRGSEFLQFLTYCALFSISIAGLGVLGLTSLAVNRRTKEIGMRKILGAPVSHIVLLLTRELIWMVAIAFVFAMPLAYLMLASMEGTSGLALKEVDAWTFVLGGLLVLGGAWLMAGSQALRVALTTPANILRED